MWGNIIIFSFKHRHTLSRQFNKFRLFWYFVIITLFIYIALQTKYFAVIYNFSETLRAIQFPWRLQCFVTVLLVIFLVAAITMLRGKIACKYLTAYIAVIVLFTLFCCLYRELRRQEYFPRSELSIVKPGNWLEYYPKTPAEKVIYLEDLSSWLGHFAELPFSVKEGVPEYLTVKKLPDNTFVISCKSSEPLVVILPAIWNKLYRICDQDNHTLRWTFGRSLEDPRLHITIPPGEHIFMVHYPTWRNALEYYFCRN